MAGEQDNKDMTQSDHDLLITLSAQFHSFEQSNSRIYSDLSDKMTRMLLLVEQKADKTDMKEVVKMIEGVDRRVLSLEAERQVRDTQKNTVINLGTMGYKGIAALAGVIIFILEVIRFATTK